MIIINLLQKDWYQPARQVQSQVNIVFYIMNSLFETNKSILPTNI